MGHSPVSPSQHSHGIRRTTRHIVHGQQTLNESGILRPWLSAPSIISPTLLPLTLLSVAQWQWIRRLQLTSPEVGPLTLQTGRWPWSTGFPSGSWSAAGSISGQSGACTSLLIQWCGVDEWRGANSTWALSLVACSRMICFAQIYQSISVLTQPSFKTCCSLLRMR